MRLIWGILALSLWVAGSATPQITFLSELSLPPNGRLTVEGKDFGSRGRLLIGNREAIVTRWSGSKIHGYVPYQLGEGAVDVRVLNGEGASNAAKLQVEPRNVLDGGRVLWRFQTDRWMNRQFIEVDFSGRIYTADHIGTYALSPIGDLLWFAPGSGGDLPIDSSPSGIVYTGVALGTGPEIVRAHDRNGDIIWRFIPPEPGKLIAGPNVGPNGNVYAVQELRSGNGLGLFALSPNGNLLWSNVGEPELGPADGITNNEIIFSGHHLYFAMTGLGSVSAITFSFDLDGNQQWHTGASGLHLPFYNFPRVDPFGRVVGARGQTGAMAINADGSVAWEAFHPGNPNVMQIPAVDSFGNIYIEDWLEVELWSLDPQGNTRWVLPRESNIISSMVGISKENRMLVNSAQHSFAGPGFVRGLLPANGVEQWRVQLEAENGVEQRTTNLYPVFSNPIISRSPVRRPEAVYFTTAFADVNQVQHGYLYAVDYR